MSVFDTSCFTIRLQLQMAFCPSMCVLIVCSESCFYTCGIDRVGWTLVRGEDGWGWSTRVPQETPPPFLMQNEWDSSPFDQQLILMKDDFTRTAKIVLL